MKKHYISVFSKVLGKIWCSALQICKNVLTNIPITVFYFVVVVIRKLLRW